MRVCDVKKKPFHFSVYFIHNYYLGSRYQPLKGFLPSFAVLGSLVISYCVTAFSEVNVAVSCMDMFYRLINKKKKKSKYWYFFEKKNGIDIQIHV